MCDSLYLVKPELTEAEISNVSGFINNQLMCIGADYGLDNMDLDRWARADLLNKELESGAHKEDYERLLKSIDRYFKFKQPKEDPYHQVMQLAALCALGRWKEAATYFPKVHRAVTDNGKYYAVELPYEVTYIQNAINSHGYKAIAPNYKAKTKSSNNNGSLIEFFMEKAINAGIEHYQKKKAEKQLREMYYESIGLDKKGRPKK